MEEKKCFVLTRNNKPAYKEITQDNNKYYTQYVSSFKLTIEVHTCIVECDTKMTQSTYRFHINFCCHYGICSATELDFSLKNEGRTMNKRSMSVIAQPRQEEALFSPVTIPRK